MYISLSKSDMATPSMIENLSGDQEEECFKVICRRLWRIKLGISGKYYTITIFQKLSCHSYCMVIQREKVSRWNFSFIRVKVVCQMIPTEENPRSCEHIIYHFTFFYSKDGINFNNILKFKY